MVRRRSKNTRNSLAVKDDDLPPKQCLEHKENDANLSYNQTPQEPHNIDECGDGKREIRHRKHSGKQASETIPPCSVVDEQEEESVLDSLDQMKIQESESDTNSEASVDLAATLEEEDDELKHYIDEDELLFYERLCAFELPTKMSEETSQCFVADEQKEESVPDSPSLQMKIPESEFDTNNEAQMDLAAAPEEERELVLGRDFKFLLLLLLIPWLLWFHVLLNF